MHLHFFAYLLPLTLLLTACGSYHPLEDYPPADATFVPPNELSKDFLSALKSEDATQAQVIADQIADLDRALLVSALDSRNKQLAFWVNIYNGMVQHLLTKDPSLYDNRGDFFGTPSFTVAGEALSPNEIEHGIIRGGENRLGLGFIPQIFVNKYERTFKIDGGDSRVHFALNCGAADCPPVAIYDPTTYDEQINARVRSYLAEHSELKSEAGKEVIYTSPLFSWFRGDFKDRGGIDEFLVEYGILNEDQKDIDREYTDYDWTLQTGIWAEPDPSSGK